MSTLSSEASSFGSTNNPQRHEMAKTFVAGLVAGCFSRTLTAPLDRIKLLMQEGRILQHTMPHPTVHILARDLQRPRYSVPEIIRVVIREGGLRSFWRGNGVNCLKSGPEFATMFTARHFFEQHFRSTKRETSVEKNLLENFVLAAAAGATAQMLIYPMELLKARMAVASSGEFSGLGDCISQCWKRGGAREFYKGLGANLSGIVPNRGIEMGLFFSLEDLWRSSMDYSPPVGVLTLIGMVSSTFAQVATYPLNLVRLKMQIQGVNGRPVIYTSVTHCIRHILCQEGWRGLFRGLLPNLIKGVPASTTMYVTFRATKNALDDYCGPRKEKAKRFHTNTVFKASARKEERHQFLSTTTPRHEKEEKDRTSPNPMNLPR